MKIYTPINELDDSFQDCDINAMSTRSTNRLGDRSMDLLTGLQAETVYITPHLFLDQITEIITTTPTAMTHTADRATTETTTDRATTETTIETEDTNIIQDMTKETRTTKTGMITIKIETGLTTEDNQTNISTTGANPKHKSSSNTQIRIY